mgnify:FL=1
MLPTTTIEKEVLVAEPTALQYYGALELEFRKRVGGTFRQFIDYVLPDYPHYKHIEKMVEVLDRVANDELHNVMFFMPPQYFKSTTVSRLFSAYYLFRHPERFVGMASYSGDLAVMMSRASMDFYCRGGMKLHPDVQSTREWMTQDGGGMWSAGVGGSITGRSGALGIIDDPFKDEKEAYSSRIRESRIDWYRSVWSTRNFHSQILVFTRWHDADLAGYLFEEEPHNPKHWHIVCFDAIKEQEDMKVPPTCTLEKDWRIPGEALCPEIHTSEQLASRRKTVGELFWSSLFQQRPVMMKGNLWKADWFLDPNNQFMTLPEGCVNDGYDWDTAQTDDVRNAANAFVRSVVKRGEHDTMYVTDIDWEWFEFPELVSWMKSKPDAPHYVENKSSGKDVVSTLKSENIAAKEVSVKGDKESRTALVVHHIENGRVKIAAHLIDKLLNDGKQGILAFPRGKHRDLNDAFVQAINRQLVNSTKVEVLFAI